ncbi:MAG TPA: hypothetical protein VGH99_18160 [Pseudonocardia sp.]|jgi:hypothetical protein
MTTQEETVAKPAGNDHIDPSWPELPDGDHAVSELASPVQGSMSPFGDLEFPLDSVPYVHPVTEINR